MEEQLIGFETAKLAQEKGCQIYTDDFIQYNDKEGWARQEKGVPRYYAQGCQQVSLMPQSVLQKWLREEHAIDVSVFVLPTGKHGWYIDGGKRGMPDGSAGTNEEALEKGLYEGLKKINTKEVTTKQVKQYLKDEGVEL